MYHCYCWHSLYFGQNDCSAEAGSQQLHRKADEREDGGTPKGQRIRSEGKRLGQGNGAQSQAEDNGPPEGLPQGSAGKAGGWAGRLKSLFTISGRGGASP